MPQALSDKADKVIHSKAFSGTATLASGASFDVTVIASDESGRPSGSKVVVVGLHNVSLQMAMTGDMSVTIKSGSTALTGPMRFSKDQITNFNTAIMPDGHFKSSADEAIVVTLKNEHASTRSSGIFGYLTFYYE
tara:strand:- start:3792 stop:4196 length:405 start_codon:yes stop_codon:yes gene_type:complete